MSKLKIVLLMGVMYASYEFPNAWSPSLEEVGMMRCGNWYSPEERSVGHAAEGIEVEEVFEYGAVVEAAWTMDVVRNGVTVGVAAVPVAGRVVGSKVGTVLTTVVEVELSGRPRAVQLNPPVLN